MITKTKKCSTCKDYKDLHLFTKNKSTITGLANECKPCKSKRDSIYREKNREVLKRKKRKYRSISKDHINKTKSDWKAKNYEKVLKHGASYRERHRLKIREKDNAWAKENPNKKNHQGAMRRASKLLATPKWLTTAHKRAIQAIYTKAHTIAIETNIKHHVDHKIPLRGRGVCGLHVPWNLQVLTQEQNLKKSNKLLEEHRRH